MTGVRLLIGTVVMKKIKEENRTNIIKGQSKDQEIVKEKNIRDIVEITEITEMIVIEAAIIKDKEIMTIIEIIDDAIKEIGEIKEEVVAEAMKKGIKIGTDIDMRSHKRIHILMKEDKSKK